MEKEEQEVKVKKSHPVQVKVIEKDKSTCAVEWIERGLVKRVYVPVTEVNEYGAVDASILSAGLPYGLVFDIDQELIDALHNAGIWTKEDVVYKRPVINAVLSKKLIHPILHKLLEAAKK